MSLSKEQTTKSAVDLDSYQLFESLSDGRMEIDGGKWPKLMPRLRRFGQVVDSLLAVHMPSIDAD